MKEQDWDETESEEDENERLDRWLTHSRALWYIILETSGTSPEIGKPEKVERPLFAGIWEIQDDFDPDTGQMILSGLPDWPMQEPFRTEVHRIPPHDRADKYRPGEYLEHAFEHAMIIRALDKSIKNKRKDGDKTIISLDQELRLNHLRLSGRLEDF